MAAPYAFPVPFIEKQHAAQGITFQGLPASGTIKILTIAGEEVNFGANSTIIVPPNAVHQLVNSGAEEMFLLGVLGVTPVNVTTAEGETIPLPWQ